MSATAVRTHFSANFVCFFLRLCNDLRIMKKVYFEMFYILCIKENSSHYMSVTHLHLFGEILFWKFIDLYYLFQKMK